MLKVLYLTCILFGYVNLITCERNFEVLEESTTTMDFLILQDSFAPCSNPTVIDGAASGAKGMCMSQSTCKFVQWNQRTKQIQLCFDNSYLTATPKLEWVIGVKSSLLGHKNFSLAVNQHSVCTSPLATEIVNDIEDAVNKCQFLGCHFFSINFNQGLSTGPAFGPKQAWFCKYIPITTQREGFVTYSQTNEEFEKAPSKQFSIKAPCGLNGPISKDSYFPGSLAGEIIEESKIKLKS